MAKLINTIFDFGGLGGRIIGLLAPTQTDEAATKGYVDSLVEGLAWKDNARVSTQANIDIASPGATIDGIAMATNDRVLVRSQTVPAENGIYIWNGGATPMTRAPDANTADELESAVLTVDEGTDANTTFRQTAVNFVLDTDDITWASFGTSAPAATETTAGIIEIATQAETDSGVDDTRAITPAKLANWSGGALKHSATIGDGSATQYTVTHNLGTRDCHVTVRRDSGNYDDVVCDISRPTINSVQLNFASAPASNAYRVTVTA